MPIIGHSAKPLPSASALGKAATWGVRWRLLCRVPGLGTRQSSRHLSLHVAALTSARTLALSKVFSLLTCEGHFAECFGLCTRQSGQIFFVSFFSIFLYKYNKNIYKCRDISGSYSNKYIIDDYENSIDTNNTSDDIYHNSDR